MAGFPEKGKEYLLEALKIDEDSIKYLDNYYGCLAENQGEYQKAVKHFEKRSQADSTNDLLLIRLGFYNSLIGNHKESLKYLKKYANWVKIKQQTTSMDRRNMEYCTGYINLQNGFRKEADIYLDKSIEDYTRFIKSAPEHEKRIYIYRLAGLYA